MGYKIYELVKPEVLKKIEPDGYSMKTRERIALEEHRYTSFSSKKEAKEYLIDNKETLKHKEFVILKTFSVDWEGTIT
jgi:hypothetical protein